MNIFDLCVRHEKLIRKNTLYCQELDDWEYLEPSQVEQKIRVAIDTLDQEERHHTDPASDLVREAWLRAVEVQLRRNNGIPTSKPKQFC